MNKEENTDKREQAEINDISVCETETEFEAPGYKVIIVILTAALIFSLCVFLGVRYFEQKSVTAPSVETLTLETAVPEKSGGDKIDINTADETALMTLPGIGQGRAADIVRYRSEYGTFESPDDILKVPGIGQSIYSQIRDYICVKNEK